MELKPGYKQTEIGILPKDWDVEFIEHVAGITTGSKNTQDRIEDGEYPFFVRSQTVERIDSYSFDGEAVLTAGDGVGTGKVFHYINGKFDVHQRVYRISDFRERLNGYFFYLYFSTNFYNRIMQMTAKSSVDSVRRDMIARMSVPVPRLIEEQNAIADALSDVDALLEGLDRLIAKKRDLKQAAMQQLLSGDTRLPGFEDEWRLVKFSDLTSPSHSRIDPSRSEPCNFCVELEHIEQGTGRLLGWSSTTPQSSLKAVFEPGDVLFGKLRAYLRKYWVADRPGVCSTEIWVFKPNPENVASGYLYQLVTTNWFIDAASTAYGTHMPRSDWKVIRELELQVPPPPEQEAIAQVLGDMDAEIEALEQRRAKTADLKQAMMQELLTGKTRLVQPQVSDEQAEAASSNAKGHNWAINEAVVIATLVKHFGKEDYPLGRKRYTKLSYLLHRRVERQAEGYLKKAAGPYNPQTKYGGPEKIAKKNGYIKQHKGPKGHSGFITADNIAQAEGYFEKWYGPEVIQWLEQFRYKKNDDLEVLATVDMAAVELRASGKDVGVAAVKAVIAGHPEWEAKLDRPVFSDANIAEAIEQSEALLGSEIAGGPHA